VATQSMVRETARRQKWMQAFESAVVSVREELSGRIDWDTATYFYHQGITPEVAAQRYLARDR
jgi:hypothetical protein